MTEYKWSNDIEKYEAVEKLFDELIRPALMNDGGNLELDLVKGHDVVISFQGACGSCPSSAGGTLRGIERALRYHIDPDAVVIPTNAYTEPTPVVHPFGGETYSETIARKEQDNENNIQKQR
jgi:Fe-S cluster biogenesis protein NfuA|tara:strand:- start:11589 stop:11954 length:366 start_codon:yes stop_codon:yes gene_type:complete